MLKKMELNAKRTRSDNREDGIFLKNGEAKVVEEEEK